MFLSLGRLGWCRRPHEAVSHVGSVLLKIDRGRVSQTGGFTPKIWGRIKQKHSACLSGVLGGRRVEQIFPQAHPRCTLTFSAVLDCSGVADCARIRTHDLANRENFIGIGIHKPPGLLGRPASGPDDMRDSRHSSPSNAGSWKMSCTVSTRVVRLFGLDTGITIGRRIVGRESHLSCFSLSRESATSVGDCGVSSH